MSKSLDNDSLIVKASTFLPGQQGVFTKRPFKKGETIFSVTGPILPEPTQYSFSLDVDKHIDPIKEDGSFDFGHFLNHSCDPNTIIHIATSEGSPSHIDVNARRDIAADEELAFDYASSEYDTVAKEVCRCGSALCRGFMHGFKDLPEDTVKKYDEEGMIPSYLKVLKK